MEYTFPDNSQDPQNQPAQDPQPTLQQPPMQPKGPGELPSVASLVEGTRDVASRLQQAQQPLFGSPDLDRLALAYALSEKHISDTRAERDAKYLGPIDARVQKLFDDHNEQMRVRELEQARQSYVEAIRDNADVASRVRRLARSLGVSEAEVETNQQVFETYYAQQAAQQQQLFRDAPVVASLTADIAKAKRLGPQAPDAWFWERFSAGWSRMGLMYEKDMILADGLKQDWSGAIELTPEQKERIAQLDEQIKNLPYYEGFWGTGAEQTRLFYEIAAVPLAVGLALAPFTGGGSVIGAGSVATTSLLALNAYRARVGSLYADLIDSGHDPVQAANVSRGAGVVMALPEVLGVGKIGGRWFQDTVFKTFGPRWLSKLGMGAAAQQMTVLGKRQILKNALKHVASAAAFETLEEEYELHVQMLSEAIAKAWADPAYAESIKQGEEAQQAYWSRVLETAKLTLIGTPLPTMIMQVPGALSDLHRARRASLDAAYVDRINTQAGKLAPLLDRDPELSDELISRVNARVGGGRMLIEAGKLREVLLQLDAEDAAANPTGPKVSAQSVLAQRVPELARQLDAATDDNADLEMSVADYTRTLARMPLAKRLRQHLRIATDNNPNPMSLDEAMKAFGAIEKMRVAAEKAEQESGTKPQSTMSQLRARVAQQLRDTQRYTTAQISMLSELVVQGVLVRAAEAEQDPLAYYEQKKVEIVTEEQMARAQGLPPQRPALPTMNAGQTEQQQQPATPIVPTPTAEAEPATPAEAEPAEATAAVEKPAPAQDDIISIQPPPVSQQAIAALQSARAASQQRQELEGKLQSVRSTLRTLHEAGQDAGPQFQAAVDEYRTLQAAMQKLVQSDQSQGWYALAPEEQAQVVEQELDDVRQELQRLQALDPATEEEAVTIIEQIDALQAYIAEAQKYVRSRDVELAATLADLIAESETERQQVAEQIRSLTAAAEATAEAAQVSPLASVEIKVSKSANWRAAVQHLANYFSDTDEADLVDENVDPQEARAIGSQLAQLADGALTKLTGSKAILDEVAFRAAEDADLESGPFSESELEFAFDDAVDDSGLDAEQLKARKKQLQASKRGNREVVKFLEKLSQQIEEEQVEEAAPEQPAQQPDTEQLAKLEQRLQDIDANLEELRRLQGELPQSLQQLPATQAPEAQPSPEERQAEMSTRLPKGEKAMGDPIEDVLEIDYQVALRDPDSAGKHRDLILSYPFVASLLDKKQQRDSSAVVEAFIEFVKDNLLFLYNAMPESLRKRSRLWYDGARRYAVRWSERYGISAQQAAALIASLSPQKDWFVNMTMAERILDIWWTKQDMRMTEEMRQKAAEINESDAHWALYEQIGDKKLGELLSNPKTLQAAAMWLRLYDQTYNSVNMQRLSPEGGATGQLWDLTIQWQSYSVMSRALSVLRDGSRANIFLQIGQEHKVRSFYNNIVSPNSRAGHATIDTHAVAAGLLLPLASSSKYVAQAWGQRGAAGSTATGMSGLYPYYVEAYRRAAEAVGLLPREMQSITWESVRALFLPAFKRQVGKVAKAEDEIETSQKFLGEWQLVVRAGSQVVVGDGEDAKPLTQAALLARYEQLYASRLKNPKDEKARKSLRKTLIEELKQLEREALEVQKPRREQVRSRIVEERSAERAARVAEQKQKTPQKASKELAAEQKVVAKLVDKLKKLADAQFEKAKKRDKSIKRSDLQPTQQMQEEQAKLDAAREQVVKRKKAEAAQYKKAINAKMAKFDAETERLVDAEMATLTAEEKAAWDRYTLQAAVYLVGDIRANQENIVKARETIEREYDSDALVAMELAWQAAAEQKRSAQSVRDEIVRVAEGQTEDPTTGFRPMFWEGSEFDPNTGRTYEGQSQRDADQAVPPQLAGMREEPPRVAVEVAPDPNDEAALARWKALQPSTRQSVSLRVFHQVIPLVLAHLNVAGQFREELGGYLDEVNSSMLVTLASPMLTMDLAKLLGLVLNQDSVFVASRHRLPGMEAAKLIRMTLPDGVMSAADVAALWAQMRSTVVSSEGKPVLGGFTFVEGAVDIAWGSYDVEQSGGLSAEQVAQQLAAVFTDFQFVTYDFNTALVRKGTDYGVPREQAGGRTAGESLVEKGLDSLRAKAAAILERELESATKFEAAAGRDGGGSRPRGSLTPLEGAPTHKGSIKPIPHVVEAARRYARSVGIPDRRPGQYVLMGESLSRRIGAAYDEMADNPSDPKVDEAYTQLLEQTRAQYDALVEAGISFWLFDIASDPYAKNPWAALRDLQDNKRMGVFATEAGYGMTGITQEQRDSNPLLQLTGIRWPSGSPDGPLVEITYNDLFRAVHDVFGHGLEGAGFRMHGEENAWQAHARLYYGAAVAALTSETRGQNSWLNSGPDFAVAEANRTASLDDTVFAPQKIGLMPEWTWTEGLAPDAVIVDETVRKVPPQREVRRKAGEAVRKLRERKRKDKSLEQQGEQQGLRSGPRGEFFPDQMRILLRRDADMSTFLHEMSHLLMTLLMQDAMQENASDRTLEQANTLLEWFGIASLDAWNALGLEGQRKYHERFAYNWEYWMSTGAAPSSKLEALFQAATRWLTRVYRQVFPRLSAIYQAEFGEELPMLTSDVARVMAGMLASEEDVARSDYARAARAVFLTREQAMADGMTEAEWDRLQEAQQRNLENATQQLNRRKMRMLRRLGRAASKVTQDVQEKWARVRANVRDEVEQRIRLLREYRVLHWMQTGTYRDESGEEQLLPVEGRSRRLSRQKAEQLAQSLQSAGKIPSRWSLENRLADLTADRGSDPEEVAVAFGYDNVEDMLLGLLNAKPMEEAIEQETDRQMQAQYKIDPDGMAIQDEIALALHTAEREQVIALELRHDMDVLRRQAAVETEEQQQASDARRKAQRAELSRMQKQQKELTEQIKQLREQQADEGFAAERQKLDAAEQQAATANVRGTKEEQKAAAKAVKDARAELSKAKQAADEQRKDAMKSLRKQLRSKKLTLQERQQLQAQLDALIDTPLRQAENRRRELQLAIGRLRKDLTGDAVSLRSLAAAARKAAQAILRTTKVSQVRATQYETAAARARKAAAQAKADNNLAEAVTQKGNELVQHELARQAAELAERISNLKKFMRQLFGTDGKVGSRRMFEVVLAARMIASLYGLAPEKHPDATPQAAQALIDQIRVFNPPLADEFARYAAKAVEIATARAQAAVESGRSDPESSAPLWQDLTAEQFMDLEDLLQTLWKYSQQARTLELEGRRIEVDRLAGELTLPLQERTTQPDVRWKGATTRWQRLRLRLSRMAAQWRIVEAWAEDIDGMPEGRVGPWTSLVRSVMRQLDAYRVRAAELRAEVTAVLKGLHDLGDFETPVVATELGGYVFRSRAQLLGALAQAGNESNLRRLLLGMRREDDQSRRWGQDEDGQYTTAAWEEFVERMIREKHLTAADFAALSRIGQIFESILPETQRAWRQIFGVPYRLIEKDKIENSLGTFDGWYWPAQRDSSKGDVASFEEMQRQIEQQGQILHPQAEHGFGMSRVEHDFQPLQMDLRMAHVHIDEAVRWAYVQPVVHQITRVLANRRLSESMWRYSPSLKSELLLPWLWAAVHQSSTETRGAFSGIAKLLRTRLGVDRMFAYAANALQQITGHAITLTRVPMKYWGRAFYRYYTGGWNAMIEEQQVSLYMQQRVNNQMLESARDLADLLEDDNWLGNLQKRVEKDGYFMQTWFQNQVDAIAWHAAYNYWHDQRMAEWDSMSDEDKAQHDSSAWMLRAQEQAVEHADSIVRLTQGSLNPEGVARVQRSSEWAKLAMQFQGFTLMLANGNLNLLRRIARTTGWKAKSYRGLHLYLFGFFLPMVLGDLISRAALGQYGVDEDDDDIDDLWFDVLVKGQARGAAAMVPVIGPLLFDQLTSSARATRTPAPAAIDALFGRSGAASVTKAAIERGEVRGETIRGLAPLFSLVTGLPFSWIARPASFVVDWQEGRQTPVDAVDAFRGLLFGGTSRAAKNY